MRKRGVKPEQTSRNREGKDNTGKSPGEGEKVSSKHMK